MKRLNRGSLLIALVALTGCGDCVSIGRFAVHVELREAGSAAPIMTSATLVLTGASFADTVVMEPGGARSAIGPEHDGRMTLSIKASGYAPYERELTITRTQHCNYLESVGVTAWLVRSPG